ncbi:hypothetical protein M5E87_13360 [Flavonifractor plautii]|nr:hypothetical protein M5E87_13360 [Flavonifractor plautii]
MMPRKVMAHDGNSAVMLLTAQVVTANEGIFAVMVDAEVNRRQNAVMVV